MRKSIYGVVFAVLAVGYSHAQTGLTTITASHISVGGKPIVAGKVLLTPVDIKGQPIAFVSGAGGGLNAPKAFSCDLATGGLTGCQVPDACLTTPANILYTIDVTATAGYVTFRLPTVVNVCGSTWALDAYAPPAQTTNVQPIQMSYGTAAAPDPCVTPSMYVRNNSGGQLYICVGGHPVLVVGSGATIAHTTAVLKGDNSGNGVAATPGTDYVIPSGNAATATLAANSSAVGGVALSGLCQTGGGGCPAGGAVNTIGVATANGVSGTSSGGTDPQLTIALGDITPTSVTVTDSTKPTQTNFTPTTHATVVKSGAASIGVDAVDTAGVYLLPRAPGSGSVAGVNNAGKVQLSITPCPLQNATNICITEPPYNAVGDGTTDNTAAFAAAIAAIAATPGLTGTIWVPPATGSYVLGTTLLDTGCANAVLPMPKIANYGANTQVNISIKGYSLPSWNSTSTGSVIKSALTTGNLIGGCDSDAGGGFPNFTNVKLEMENITINLPVNTGAVAINASNLLAFQGRHLLINTPGSGTSIPSTTTGGGIFMPQIANQVQNELDDTQCGGLWRCYIITEHTHAGRIYCVYAKNCFVFDNGTTGASVGAYTGNSTQIDYLWEQNAVNAIVGGTSGPFKNPINISLADLENTTGNGILDASNVLYGTININIPNNTGSTLPCNANISGGSHLTIHYVLCQPEAASSGGPPSGLIENWLSQEGQGSTLVNSGYDFLNPATATSVTWSSAIAGFTGKIATYNGTSSLATATSATATAFDGSTPFSACVWANLPSTNNSQTFISTLDSGSSFKGWELSTNNGTTGHLSFFLINTYPTNAISNLTMATITTGITHLLCVAYDGSKLAAGVNFYVDGAISTPTTPATIDNLTASTANTIPVSLGSRPGGGQFLNGYLGRVRIFNRLLSATEISSMYAAGSNAY